MLANMFLRSMISFTVSTDSSCLNFSKKAGTVLACFTFSSVSSLDSKYSYTLREFSNLAFVFLKVSYGFVLMS